MTNIKWDNIKLIDTYGVDHFLPALAIIRLDIPNSEIKNIAKFLNAKYDEANTFVWYINKSMFRTVITLNGVNKDIFAMYKEISWHVTAGSTDALAA